MNQEALENLKAIQRNGFNYTYEYDTVSFTYLGIAVFVITLVVVFANAWAQRYFNS